MLYNKSKHNGAYKTKKNMNQEDVLRGKLPLVSVVMTTYNGERFLAEQLESLFAQSYSNLEIIICDDCSTDSTVSILRYFDEKKVNKGLL